MLNDEITVLIKYISKIKVSEIENDEDCVDLKRALLYLCVSWFAITTNNVDIDFFISQTVI